MIVSAIVPCGRRFAVLRHAGFAVVLGAFALAPGLARAQTAGYAPAYPPDYLSAQHPPSGAVPAPVTAVPIPPPGTAVPMAPPGASDTAPDAADLQYIVKPLTEPDLPANAPPRAFLQAAQAALATGHDGEAQQAMEMAQTRLLDRSVPLYQTGKPSANPAVDGIGAALSRLSAGDRSGAMRQLDTVLAMFDRK